MARLAATSALPLSLCLVLAACGVPSPGVAPIRAGLTTCNLPTDCPLPGACVTMGCSGNVCRAADLPAPCCTTGIECDDGNPCTVDGCDAGACTHTPQDAVGCCTVSGDCAAAGRCQSAPQCLDGSCTYTADLTGPDGDCCNADADCGAAASCVNNVCTCPAGFRYCVPANACVADTACCLDAECTTPPAPAGCYEPTGTCTAGSCGYTVAPGNQVCGTVCCRGVNGTCDASCQLTCTLGFDDCNNDPSDGCETRLDSITHCGQCNRACDTVNSVGASCIGGACSYADCAPGRGDCDVAPPNTNGCETDLTASLDHCGGCGRSCSNTGVASRACVGGVCTSTCQAGRGNCILPAAPIADDGCETDTTNDPDHCGACPTVCPAGNACQARSCTASSCGFAPAAGPGCCATVADCPPPSLCEAAACIDQICTYASTGDDGCCETVADCPLPPTSCVDAVCEAHICTTRANGSCMVDLSFPPDLAVPEDMAVPEDLSREGLRLTGGSGCAVGGERALDPGGALLLVLLLVVAAPRARRQGA